MSLRLLKAVFIAYLSFTTACSSAATTPAPTSLPLPTSTPWPTLTPPVPTLTPTSQPTATPEKLQFVPVNLELSSQEFVIAETVQTAPQDILRELGYSGNPGGWGDPCFGKTFSFPTILLDQPKIVEWDESVKIDSCGWKPNEVLSYRLIGPDGQSTLEGTINTNEEGINYYLGIEIGINFEPGDYLFEIQGESGKSETTIMVRIPEGPRVYQDRESKQILLYNFQHGEHVRLLTYGDSLGILRLAGWQEFNTNEAGQSRIHYDLSDLQEQLHDPIFVVVGDESGVVYVAGTYRTQDYAALSPTVVKAHMPTEGEYRDVESIWSRLNYQDLMKPGRQDYELSVNPDEPLRWRFSWCGVDAQTLKNITKPLTVEFRVNGVTLLSQQIGLLNETSPNGNKCQRWTTFIPEWPVNTQVILEIFYSLSESIFDGATTYPAGDYYQVITVNVKE